ncbi:hypothetical protein QQ008_02735 [Fulvivirgaceae bacterium BMA10]|uniref:TfoX N-terminal domain-containing protein n=1 Tax=Splendidivirga corallicola TaxID=3051826 RepID=A0ABT8KKZ9_9BACT|nr:hypothetical protein [Fulvivirgaceae bacterium BMA10]
MSAKKKAGDIPQDKLDRYDELIEAHPDIERKGASMPYTSHNGHMFTFLGKGGSIGLRLPKEEREDFLTKYETGLYETHGTVLKEYVIVPADLLQNTEKLRKYLDLSFEYVKTLKPKPSKKKK